MNENEIDDTTAAAAFRRLLAHLRHRSDVQNIDLMGEAGFCRNCLADWISEADPAIGKEDARKLVYGIPYAQWREKFQAEATPEQLARMKQSVAKNA